jgi:2-iminobutanoate/2-iminopropanoate deaminase
MPYELASCSINPLPWFSQEQRMILRPGLAAAIILWAALTPAVAQNSRRHIVLEPSPKRNAAPWSDAVLDGNTLYLSGYIGVDPKTGKVPASAKDETKLALDDLKHTVESAGMSMDDLVKVEVFGTDLTLFDSFNSVYRTYFHNGFPARIFIGCSKLLAGAHFEVTGIAIKHGK